MRSVSPDGPTTVPYGPEAVHASPSARPGSEPPQPTPAISGRSGSVSSASADLQSSLESRLKALCASAGSTLYSETWKTKATPAGRSYSAHTASAPRISGRDCTGWPTPTSKHAAGGEYRDPDKAMARALGPHANDLRDFVQMAGWPTPMAGSPATDTYNEAGNTDSSRKTVALVSGWPTPAARDWKGATDERWGMNARPLNEVVVLAGPQRRLPSGEILTGSTAAMASGGRLNPAHSRWLMGLPPAWDDCAVTAMRSLPSKRRRS